MAQDFFLHLQEPRIAAVPWLVSSEGAAIQEVDFHHIRVDREKLLTDNSAEKGVPAVMSAYWIFNCQYERKLLNILVVLKPPPFFFN